MSFVYFDQMLKKTRDPLWNEEFEFTLEEPPLKESIRVEVMSKGTGFHFRSKVKRSYALT